MNIEDTEQAIIDRLAAEIDNVRVEGYPDDPVNYRLMHPNGAILVSYRGSTYAPPTSFKVVQEQRVLYDITIVTKNLRTNTGAYAYLEQIKTALTGYLIPGLKRMFPVQDGFLSDTNGIWRYGITFALNARHEEA